MTVNVEKSVRLLVFSGPIGAGKTSVAMEIVRRSNAEIVRTRDLIVSRVPSVEQRREAFQLAGDKLDDLTDHSWLSEELRNIISNDRNSDPYFILDSVRTRRQLQWLRKSEMFDLSHVHLFASPNTLQLRFEARNDVLDAGAHYNIIKKIRHESEIMKLEKEADLVLNTERASPSELSDLIIRSIWPNLIIGSVQRSA